MTLYDKQVFDLRERHDSERYQILNSADLTKAGKEKALIELANRTLYKYSALKRKLKEHIADNDAMITTLEAQDTKEELSTEQIEQLRHEGDLLLSELSSKTEPADFASAAREMAEKHPTPFVLIFGQVVELAEKIIPREAVNPDPWSGQAVEVQSRAGARLHIELQGSYEIARAANTTPAELARIEKVEAVRDSINNLMSTVSLLERFEQLVVEPTTTWGEQIAPADLPEYERARASGRRAIWQ